MAMNSLKINIQQFKEDYGSALRTVKTTEDLERVRVDFLGRNGRLADLMTQLKALSTEEKKEFGPLLNELKTYAQTAYNRTAQELENQAVQHELAQYKNFDVTAYKPNQLHGSLHLYTHIMQQFENIAISMGYSIADGPEVETEFFNFDALNIALDHPARDTMDTFWLNTPHQLMRTHTSSVQIHAMRKQKLPLAILAQGRVFRNEEIDASHDFSFTQAECLFIDTDVSMAKLLATAQTFLQQLFGTDDLKIRVRPGYFPFVEPGVEIDAQCPFCTAGCSVCKQTTWIELLGAGLVHPNVLKSSAIDTEKYSAFAMGMGIERIAMIKYGITDIRLFHSNKMDFLKQF